MTKTITLEPDDNVYNDGRTSVLIDNVLSTGNYIVDKIKDYNTGLREIRLIYFKEKVLKK